jgi:hypothetical protein
METTLLPDAAPARRPSERPTTDEPCTAESAECTCPDFCERDHDND